MKLQMEPYGSQEFAQQIRTPIRTVTHKPRLTAARTWRGYLLRSKWGCDIKRRYLYLPVGYPIEYR